jgi:hypothetical protein
VESLCHEAAAAAPAESSSADVEGVEQLFAVIESGDEFLALEAFASTRAPVVLSTSYLFNYYYEATQFSISTH